ncbi:SF0329 family protein [Ihubacter sp. rT4E-8]|uniref:SF0329 family protein n=1 Tax=Ihubacter sp. rT4E-8 TaxID=3242369 RepID=UPI003CEB8792
MGESWNAIRKKLEEDLLCEKLRGRVQYFFTIYRKAPDAYGRFAVRADGEELFCANPYNEKYYDANVQNIRKLRSVPMRQWDGNGFSFEAENSIIEEEARLLAITEGKADSFDVMRTLQVFLNQKVERSLWSENDLLRMFAILDRRVGKRTLEKMTDLYVDLPDWLKPFYALRLAAEEILLKNKSKLCLSSDGPVRLYIADDAVLDHFEELTDTFPRAQTFCEQDFVAYVKEKIGKNAIHFVKVVGNYPRIEQEYKRIWWYNF